MSDTKGYEGRKHDMVRVDLNKYVIFHYNVVSIRINITTFSKTGGILLAGKRSECYA